MCDVWCRPVWGMCVAYVYRARWGLWFWGLRDSLIPESSVAREEASFFHLRGGGHLSLTFSNFEHYLR